MVWDSLEFPPDGSIVRVIHMHCCGSQGCPNEFGKPVSGHRVPADCHGTKIRSHGLPGGLIDCSNASACVNKRALRRVATHPLQRPVYTLSGCTCNEYKSIVERHVLEQRTVTKEYSKFARRIYRNMQAQLGCVEPMSLGSLLKTRSSHVRQRWRRHLGDTTPVEKKHAYVSSFVKYEKYDEPLKVPRLIQGRGTKFTMNLARYLVPIEHRVYQYRDSNNGYLRCFAKGRNAQQRARDILNLDCFERSEWLEIDHSRFDSRVTVSHLQATHMFYRSMCNDAELSRLLQYTINNVGFTRGGIRYKCRGRRMSGDIDTGLGNSLINYTILRYVLAGIPSRIYLDGDDSVVCFDARYKSEVIEALKSRLEETGMSSTYAFRQNVSEVSFCQAKVLDTRSGPILARNPVRAVSRMCYSLGKQPPGYFGSVCFGEMHASSGVPIIYDFARANVGEPMWDRLEYRHKLNLKVKPVEPMEVARYDQHDQWEFGGVYGS